jgi:dihydroflavonol-4-reductase
VGVLVTGGAGFIGGVVVRLLVARGDAVTCLVREPTRAAAIAASGATIIRDDLSDRATLVPAMAGLDAVVHVAGMYRIGIASDERPAMWEANVGTTERVLDAAIEAGVGRIVHVSTGNVFGNTNGAIVDETFVRDLSRGWLSYYDETKYLAHEAAEARIAAGAPILVAMPGGVYGPGDHFELGRQLGQSYAGRLRYFGFGSAGLAFTHVDDVADGIVRVLDRGRVGESYNLSGEPRLVRDALAIAARVGGHRPPRLEVPTPLVRAMIPLGPRLARALGLPADLAEVIRASDGVTYWTSSAKATDELGFRARDLATGLRDTFGDPAPGR